MKVVSEVQRLNVLHSAQPNFAKGKHLAPPEFTSVKLLCDNFSKYFVDKIETIRSKFPEKLQNIPSVQNPYIYIQNECFFNLPQNVNLKSLF